MCGVIGCVGYDGETTNILLSALSTLEYRGYDSAGIAVGDRDLTVMKRAGELDQLEAAVKRRRLDDPNALDGSIGIGHTRWSTHGPPSDRNAHPHTDESGTVAVVHNGIIENYQALREELQAGGVTFTSDTDSEVVPHLMAQNIAEGDTPEEAFRRAVSRLEGSYALTAVVAGTEEIFAVRHDSPLVLGLGDRGNFVASDVPAFLEHTRDVVFLEDDQFVAIDADGVTATDEDSEPIELERTTVDWESEQTGKSGYEHFMLKEIHEQPNALRQCLSGRVDELSGRITADELGSMFVPRQVHFVACGTSYHASLYAVSALHEVGIPAQAFLASEYAIQTPPVGRDTLVIGITQSGETADTLSALRQARSRGAKTLALTNVVGSTAARECDDVLFIRAGPEIGVAATKTFTSQLAAVNVLVEQLLAERPTTSDRIDLVSALRSLPDQLQQVLDESQAQAVVDEYLDAESYFFIGRRHQYPVALEGALKFKEITYEHAEGFASGELKHGPLALVSENTPVFAMVTGNDEAARKTIGNVKEVEARDAPVVAVTDGRSDVERYADAVLKVPESHSWTAPILTNVQLQLVAYYTAAALGRSIDKPRNLAKSVTVE